MLSLDILSKLDVVFTHLYYSNNHNNIPKNFLKMTRFSTLICVLIALVCCMQANAFAPSSQMSRLNVKSSTSSIHMGFGMPDEDVKPLTRENEPEEYFSTNLDKMSDNEKIPIAIGGFLFISLPFVAGMIALYASK
mmetsp:Transcript_25490/g.31403  ORF Transcript_25490/g.31403 Transcript_25490/m.31403 type:complete len:136 (+) Transcript_25490:45-452(+)